MSVQPYHENLPAGLDEHERWLRVYGDLIDLAGRLANSPFVPDAYRGDAAATFSVLLAGHGMGMHPIAALQAIDPIKGKPYVKTEVYLGLAYRAGHTVHWGDCSDKRAVVRVVRGDGRGSAEAAYTMVQAQAAGLAGKDNWRRMPAEMLRARAVRAALKMAAPDLLLGIEAADDTLVGGQEGSGPQSGTATVVQLPDTPAPGKPTPENTVPPGKPTDPQGPPWDESSAPVRDSGPQDTYNPAEATSAPEPPTEPLVTRQQLVKMNAQLGDLERLDGKRLSRDEKRDLFRALAGLEVLESAKDLTKTQASTVIEGLERALVSARDATPVDAELVDEPEVPGE